MTVDGFDGFGLGRDVDGDAGDGGRGRVTKFGSVDTCHWVVCEFGLHRPVDMLDAVSRSGTVFSDRLGPPAVVCVTGLWVADDGCGRFFCEGRMTRVPPPWGR